MIQKKKKEKNDPYNWQTGFEPVSPLERGAFPIYATWITINSLINLYIDFLDPCAFLNMRICA